MQTDHMNIDSVKIKPHSEKVVTDELGRKIGIRRPNKVVDTNYKLACGNHHQILEEEIFLLSWVISIDDELINAPTSLIDVKRIIQILDYEGFRAVSKGIVEIVQASSSDKESLEKKAN